MPGTSGFFFKKPGSARDPALSAAPAEGQPALSGEQARERKNARESWPLVEALHAVCNVMKRLLIAGKNRDLRAEHLRIIH